MKFLFRGIYYPVLGSSVGWVNGKTKCAFDRRFGGWDNADKWYSFSYGIHCKLFDHNKPYRQFVIDKIYNHPQMEIVKEYFDDSGSKCKKDHPEAFSMTSVKTPNGSYIGNIGDAYAISDYKNLRNSNNKDDATTTINSGYDPTTQIAYGWSHRDICGFTIGDKIIEEYYGNENTPFNKHGSIEIKTYSQARESATNFAKYVS